jgi:threonine dehydrogenase-like Zn-dependent dehydrogenase
MKTNAAVLLGPGKDWEVVELELDAPKVGEVLVRWEASGLCHSDEHMRDGTLPVRFPIVGGHEGAGVVEEVGEGVTRIKPGDHIVCSFLPVCGHCRWCARGKSYLCDNGALILEGSMLDGTFRFHGGGQDFGALDLLGSFSQHAIVSESACIRIDDDVPLASAAMSPSYSVRADSVTTPSREHATRARSSSSRWTRSRTSRSPLLTSGLRTPWRRPRRRTHWSWTSPAVLVRTRRSSRWASPPGTS